MDDPIDTNIDLNQHPVADPSPESQSLETPQNEIQDRFRALEALNSVRVRRPQRVVNDSMSNLNNDIKRNVSYLEKALEMNLDYGSENKKIGDNEKGNYFDCNVCLSMARDPVLTCCGHLFCWGCFYKVPYVDSISKECPVCKGEVIDSNVVPIYGNGNGNEKGMGKRALELDSGLTIPPRPRARRVESVRQENIGQEFHHVMMANAVRRIRAVQETAPSQSVNSLGSTSNAERNREARQFSRSGPMLSSSASPLNRYLDFDTHISNGAQPVYRDRVTSVFNASVSIQTVFQRNVAAATAVHSGTLPTNGSVEIDVTISGPRRRRRRRRRRGVSPAMNLEGESSVEFRRRLR
uniref:uncharacterized protein LOC122582455 n=1 Tax=Erigeron canadensis TaxID=72917 RepID=UPI001CB99A28|nr:uncharacterized protein LOC122582455 [Erigeron canadensis]